MRTIRSAFSHCVSYRAIALNQTCCSRHRRCSHHYYLFDFSWRQTGLARKGAQLLRRYRTTLPRHLQIELLDTAPSTCKRQLSVAQTTKTAKQTCTVPDMVFAVGTVFLRSVWPRPLLSASLPSPSSPASSSAIQPWQKYKQVHAKPHLRARMRIFALMGVRI